MRYLRIAVQQEPESRHPMHQFVVDRDGYSVTRLLEYVAPPDAVATFLFHVEGPVEPYLSAVADVPGIRECDASSCPDETFYLYVREEISGRNRAFVDAFSQPGLVGVMPVEYRADGTVRLTAVGPAARLQAAVDETPDSMDVEVLEVGEYDARRLDAGSELTDRQFEAVAAAVELGYYEATRQATVADVGEALDCAPGTAAELLRRAERSVMRWVVSTGPGM